MQSNAIKTQILRFLPIHHPKKCTNPISLLAADTLGSVYWHTTCMILNNLERQSLFVYVNYMDHAHGVSYCQYKVIEKSFPLTASQGLSNQVLTSRIHFL